MFVPSNGLLDCWELTIENKSSKEKELSVYSYAGIDTALSPIDGFSKAYFSEKLNGIIGLHNGDKIASDVCYMYFSSSEKPTAYETSNRRFKGVYSDIGHPTGIKDADILSSKGTCFELKIGAEMQFDVTLPKGSVKKLYFVLGAAKNEDEAASICKKYLSESDFNNELNFVKEKIDKFQSNITIYPAILTLLLTVYFYSLKEIIPLLFHNMLKNMIIFNLCYLFILMQETLFRIVYCHCNLLKMV